MNFFYFFYNAIFLRLIQNTSSDGTRNSPFLILRGPFFHSLIPQGIDLSLFGSLRSPPNNSRTSQIEKTALFEEFITLSSLLPRLFSLFQWGQSKYVRKFEISQRIFENCVKWKKNIDFSCYKIANLRISHFLKFPEDLKDPEE